MVRVMSGPMPSDSVRVLTVGSIPPEWGGPSAGGVATVHRAILEAFIDSETIELVGVIPARSVDESLVPSRLPIVNDISKERYEELAASADVILMNHVAHRWGDHEARSEGTPVVGFIHSWAHYLESSNREEARRRIQKNIGGMSYLVFPSDACAGLGASLGFEYPVGVRVIRNTVPLMHADRMPLQRRRGVVFVGTLNDRKRAHLVVDACARLQAPLTIVGDGPNRADLEVLAEGGDVQFAGEVPPLAVRELLLSSEALCVPSRSEGFPLVYLEAAASGTPSVGHGPTIDELSDAVGMSCGVGVSPDASIDEVESALREVLGRRWRHRTMRRRVLDVLGPGTLAPQFVELVHEVAAAASSEDEPDQSR